MSCSKDSAVNYLINKMLVKPNMELYSSLPSVRLINTIDRLTKLAKTEYGVNMGDLFTIKFREVSVGNYLVEGSRSIQTRVRIEPNEPAFEAIDRSKQQEINARESQLDDYRHQQMGKVAEEYKAIQEEGNFNIDSEGNVVVPTSLPLINIQC